MGGTVRVEWLSTIFQGWFTCHTLCVVVSIRNWVRGEMWPGGPKPGFGNAWTLNSWIEADLEQRTYCHSLLVSVSVSEIKWGSQSKLELGLTWRGLNKLCFRMEPRQSGLVASSLIYWADLFICLILLLLLKPMERKNWEWWFLWDLLANRVSRASGIMEGALFGYW